MIMQEAHQLGPPGPWKGMDEVAVHDPGGTAGVQASGNKFVKHKVRLAGVRM